MRHFLSFVEYTVAVSVLVSAVANYLIVNKLWSRRDKKPVAESISIGAALLGLATAVPFFVQFTLIDHSLWPAVKTGIGILTGVVFVLIGSGVWVHENRGTGIGRLVFRALTLERRESGDLIRALVQPKGADRILDVLQRMAALDSELHEKEVALIREFAERWRLPVPELRAGAVDTNGDLLAVRAAVERYLDLHPPAEQARDLVDLLAAFVRIDDVVSAGEESTLEEIRGLVGRYAGGDGAAEPMHEVVIVPQDAEQFQAVGQLIPNARLKKARGGRVFSIGTFYSPAYAEQVCQKYIALGLFTTHVELEVQARVA